MISVKIIFSSFLICCLFCRIAIADKEFEYDADDNVFEMNTDDTDSHLPSKGQDLADVDVNKLESERESSSKDSAEKNNEIRSSDEKDAIVDGAEYEKRDKKKNKQLFRESSESKDIFKPSKGKSEKHKLEREPVKGDKPKKSKKSKGTVHSEQDNNTYQIDSSKENEDQRLEIETTPEDEKDHEEKAEKSEEVSEKRHPKFPQTSEEVEGTENGSMNEEDTKDFHPNAVPNGDLIGFDRFDENKATKAKTPKKSKKDKSESRYGKINSKEVQSNEELDAQDHRKSKDSEESRTDDVVIHKSSSSMVQSFLIMLASLACLPLLVWWSTNV